MLGVVFALLVSTAHAEHAQQCDGRNYALPDDKQIVCSATWQFTGNCSGHDMWNEWKVTGRTNSPDAFVHPWLDQPIIVIGYELTRAQFYDFTQPVPLLRNLLQSYFMIGSSIVPDAMAFLPPGERHMKQMWPAGMGQPWPPSGEIGNFIDLHGVCYGGKSISVLLTIYYTPINP